MFCKEGTSNPLQNIMQVQWTRSASTEAPNDCSDNEEVTTHHEGLRGKSDGGGEEEGTMGDEAGAAAV